MDVQQALNTFWNSFGVIAFQENSVPDQNAFEAMQISPYPRITYGLTLNDFGVPTSLSASVWDRSESWKTASQLNNLIFKRLKDGGVKVNYDDGQIWIKTGTPFSSEMSDPDDMIKRYVINIETEYLEV